MTKTSALNTLTVICFLAAIPSFSYAGYLVFTEKNPYFYEDQAVGQFIDKTFTVINIGTSTETVLKSLLLTTYGDGTYSILFKGCYWGKRLNHLESCEMNIRFYLKIHNSHYMPIVKNWNSARRF